MSAARISPLVDTRVIYCGDNLEQLPKLPDACVDLIYIDPPWNSNRNYEIFWGETQEKRSFDDRHESTRAYIDYMRPRCEQLARVLKPTGSFYYHCDWHASHYVKVMLDQIFEENNFQNEVVWKRTTAHNDPQRYGNIHDVLLFYTGGKQWTWNPQPQDYSDEYLASKYRYEDAKGKYRLDDISAPAHGGSGLFEWRGFKPPQGRMWRYSLANLEALDKEGVIYWTPKGRGGGPGFPQLKHYLKADGGVMLQSIWTDIPPINSQAQERLGYPTQKPVALLERIVNSSSNENDIVLDAFCGCGTALVAAQSLKRQWIGIDISPTSCRVMAKRLRKDCGLPEDETLWAAGRGFVVRDLPWSEEKLRIIPPFEFENWAVVALGGRANKAKVGDKGIDGRIYPASAIANAPSKQDDELDFMDNWYPVQVKQEDKAGRPEVDQFETAMNRAKRTKGFFVSFGYTNDAMQEIDRFFRQEHKVIIPLTVREILDGDIAKKLV